MFRFAQSVVILFIAVGFGAENRAHAAVVVNMTGTPGDPTIHIDFSGTAMEMGGNATYAAMVFRFESNYATFGMNSPIVGDAAVTNIDRMLTPDPITRIFISVGLDDFGISIPTGVNMRIGETMSFSGGGTFQMNSGGTFDNLIVGTYQGMITSSGLNENPVTLNITAVPEPSTFAPLGTASLVVSLWLWRRKRSQCPRTMTLVA